MNSENFKEEFSKLLRQFSTTPTQDKNDQPVASLSRQEIFDAVQEVLDSKFDVTLVDGTRDDIRTPASGIVVTTPDAPDIPKINIEENADIPKIFQSLDSLVSESLTNSSDGPSRHSDPFVSTPKVEENNNGFATDLSNSHFEERKFMSKSSPAVNTLVRSDTFVRDDEFKSVENGDVFEQKKNQPHTSNGFGSEHGFSGSNLSDYIKKLKMLKDGATNLVNIIDDMQKDVSENIRPIRRLSAIGCFPGLRTSKLTRRSLSAFPGTPTSSRLTPGASNTKESATTRRKSTSTVAAVNNTSSKLVTPTTYRSVSSGALTLPKSLSLPSGAQSAVVKSQKTLGMRSPSCPQVNVSVNRRTITPRVQSTATKTGITLGKRKANEKV